MNTHTKLQGDKQRKYLSQQHQPFWNLPSLRYGKHRIFFSIPVFDSESKCKAYFRKQLQRNLVTALSSVFWCHTTTKPRPSLAQSPAFNSVQIPQQRWNHQLWDCMFPRCFIMLIALFKRDHVSSSATTGTQTKLPIKQQSSHSDFLMVKQPALWGNIQVSNGRTWKEVDVCEWQLRAHTDTEEAIKRTILVLILHSATSFQMAGPCRQSIPYSVQEVPVRIFQW